MINLDVSGSDSAREEFLGIYHGEEELTALDERILDVAICSKGLCRRTKGEGGGQYIG